MSRAAAPSLPCCPRHRLNYALHKAVSRTAWATAHGVALREVDGVLAGRLAPGDAMLAALELERVTEYRERRSISEDVKRSRVVVDEAAAFARGLHR